MLHREARQIIKIILTPALSEYWLNLPCSSASELSLIRPTPEDARVLSLSRAAREVGTPRKQVPVASHVDTFFVTLTEMRYPGKWSPIC